MQAKRIDIIGKQGGGSGSALNAKPISNTAHQWRCMRCNKLLGVCRDERVHLHFARNHEYLVGFPVVATCRGCGTLNHVTAR